MPTPHRSKESRRHFTPGRHTQKRSWAFPWAALLLYLSMGLSRPVWAHETGRDILARHLRHLRHAVEWSGHATFESISNLVGGIRRGTTGAAAVTGGLAVNTRRAGGWSGGAFQFQVMGLKRFSPRESHLVGDAQGASNLYNSFSFLRVIALVYRQRLVGTTLIRGGIMDVNSYFDTSNAASDLINSSFGMTPTLTVNLPLTPTAPYTGWGLMFRTGQADNRVRLAVFSGDPAARGIVTHQGAFAVAEWQGQPFPAGRLKIGGWAYYNPEPPAQGSLASPRDTNGLYAVLESHHAIGSSPGWGWFIQSGVSPGRVNPIPYYLGVGFRLRGLIPAEPRSALTAGVAQAWIRNHTSETAWEVAFDDYCTPRTIIEPDIQYIMHPSGIHPNAWVVLLRLRRNF